MFKTRKAAAFTLVLLVGACASPPRPPSTVNVPEQLKPSSIESLAMIVQAKGVQIYECRERKNQGDGYEWAFVAPEADLFDARGNKVGRHYAGPHWEAIDGSKVQGTVKQRAEAPTANAIPWLLLAAKSTWGYGVFDKTASIQRVNTVGGVAPASPCDASSAKQVARVPYTATYYFYRTGS